MCDCISQMNEQMKGHNAKIAMSFFINGSKVGALPIIAVEKTDKSSRKPAPIVVASHCPFCGAKFEQQPETKAA